MDRNTILPAGASPPREGALPPEYAKTDAPEFFPPPPEFGASGAASPKTTKKRRRFRRVTALPAVALLGFLCLYAGGVVPLPEKAPAQPVTTQETPSAEQPSELPSEQPSAQLPEEPSVTPPEEPSAPYPIAARRLVITVFSGTLDEHYETVTVLHTEVENEEEFTSLELPAPEDIEKFSFYGYVIHNGHPDPGLHAEGEPADQQTFILPVGETLTRAHVEQVPVASDGVRYVNVTANWISDTDPETPESEMQFVLDDGQGHRKRFDAQNPLYSEGFLYVCAYPEPEPRPGFAFVGWFDSENRRVDALQSFFSFYEPKDYDADGNVIDAYWDRPVEVVLTAGWRPTE